jgi:hypothetical protein
LTTLRNEPDWLIAFFGPEDKPVIFFIYFFFILFLLKNNSNVMSKEEAEKFKALGKVGLLL